MPRILIQNQKKLSKEEKENRCQYIAGLFRKGWSKLTITEHISNEWGISKQSAANWIKQTYKYINSHDESFVKNLSTWEVTVRWYDAMRIIGRKAGPQFFSSDP